MKQTSFFLIAVFFVLYIFPEGFVGSTKILTCHGYWNIENLSVGQSIISYNLKKDKRVACKIKQIRQQKNSYFIRLYFDDYVIDALPDQLFYLRSYCKWIHAEALVLNNTYANAFSCETDFIHAAYVFQPVVVYCLTTNTHHNFFVSKNDLLVHNMGLATSIITASEFAAAGVGGVTATTVFGLLPQAATWINPITGLLAFATGCICAYFFDKHQRKKKKNRQQKQKFKQRQNDQSVKCCTSCAQGQPCMQGGSQPPRSGCTPEELAWRKKNAEILARELGYIYTGSHSHHEKLFYNKEKRTYISIDNTCHKGGFWKMFNHKEKRIGTFNKNLTIKIGD